MHHHIALILTLISILISPCYAWAQSSGRKTVQQSSLWFWAGANVRLHKVFGLQAESVVRLSDFQANQQHEAHIGADFYVNDNLIITPVAYGFFLNYSYGKLPTIAEQDEHRLWHQIVYRRNMGRVGLGLRLRMEENWRERKAKDTDGNIYVAEYTFKPRIRTRFQTNIALNHRSMTVPKTVFLSLWNETFIAYRKKVTYHLPEENRAHIGLGYRPNNWAMVTAGYMHHLLIRANGLQAESNHTLVLQANFNINARKKSR